jgi:hypothetical protein
VRDELENAMLEVNRRWVNKKIAGEAKPFYASSTPISIDGVQ